MVLLDPELIPNEGGDPNFYSVNSGDSKQVVYSSFCSLAFSVSSVRCGVFTVECNPLSYFSIDSTLFYERLK